MSIILKIKFNFISFLFLHFPVSIICWVSSMPQRVQVSIYYHLVRPTRRDRTGVGRGNCSVSDTINTLGGGPAVFETLIHMVAKCGGVQFCDSKTLPHMVAKCGGGWSRELKTVTHDGVWYRTGQDTNMGIFEFLLCSILSRRPYLISFQRV